MIKNRQLLLAISFGLVAAMLSGLYLYLKGIEISGGSRLVRVFVAERDIDSFSIIEPGIVRVKKIPQAYVEPSAITDVNQISGLVNIVSLKKGEQITGNKIVIPGMGTGLSFKIPRNKRAVSIALDPAGAVSGLISPDDYVDVMLVIKNADTVNVTQALMLFQNIRVLATNKKIHSKRTPLGLPKIKTQKELFSNISTENDYTSGSIVTLELDPEEAQNLIFAEHIGRISLILRQPSDHALMEKTSAVNLDAFIRTKNFIKQSFKEYRGM